MNPTRCIPDIDKIDDAQLNAWGITRQQMKQAFVPKQPHRICVRLEGLIDCVRGKVDEGLS